MNRHSILAAVLLLAAALLGSACHTDNDYDYETTGNCIITAATLGTLTRTLHTLSSTGADSTYTVTVTGSDYPLTIDQLRSTVFNPDSLPVGTDMQKIVFSAFSVTGSKSIKSLETGEDTIFTATDSTDFSVLRYVTTYATDGLSRRIYTIDLRCHKEWGDSTTWTRGGTHADVAALLRGRAFATAGVLQLFAQDAEGQRYTLSSPFSSPVSFGDTTRISDTALDVRSIQRHGDDFFALSGGQLVKSADGKAWSREGLSETHFSSLFASGSQQLFALQDGEIYSSADAGFSWQREERDASSPLPVANVSGAVVSTASDPTWELAYLVGTREGRGEVWCRRIDLKGNEVQPWMQVTTSTEDGETMPLLDNYTLLPYDEGGLLLLGEAGGALSNLYLSLDGGQSWDATQLKRPDVATATAVCATVGERGQVYLLLGGTGEVWYGHLNRLGWDDVKMVFTK